MIGGGVLMIEEGGSNDRRGVLMIGVHSLSSHSADF